MTKMSQGRKLRKGIQAPAPQPAEPPVRPIPKSNCAGCVFIDTTTPIQPFCRRYPPQLVVVRPLSDVDSGVRKFFPVVDPMYDWCGEHKPPGTAPE